MVFSFLFFFFPTSYNNMPILSGHIKTAQAHELHVDVELARNLFYCVLFHELKQIISAGAGLCGSKSVHQPSHPLKKKISFKVYL